MTTLDNTYCRPTTEAEWDLICSMINPKSLAISINIKRTETLGFYVTHNGKGKLGFFSRNDSECKGMTKIPVQQFIDLLEDRIVPWRLKEIGFEYNEYRGKVLSELSKYITTENENHCIDFDPNDGIVKVNLNGFEGVETFTDLLTLIRFLK